VTGCCECGDEPSGSYATELVRHNMCPTLTEFIESSVLNQKIT
jgi:hypothetical protein